MNQTSKQLREEWEEELLQLFVEYNLKHKQMEDFGHVQEHLKIFIRTLLDSVREEYKGIIEGLRINIDDKDWFDGYKHNIEEHNSKLDEVLKIL